MCVMFVAVKGQAIPSYTLMKAGWGNNPHGAGFMYPDPETSTLRIVKGLMTWTAFKSAFAKHRSRFSNADGIATVDVAAHFRIRSHGPVDAAMTHPHVIVPDKIALMHNGIIHGLRPSQSLSDTAVFVEDCLAKLPKGWQRNTAIKELIAGRINQGNKLIIFDQHGLAGVVNRASGVVNEGIWWSNGHHLRHDFRDEFGCEAPVMNRDIELKSATGRVMKVTPDVVIKSASHTTGLIRVVLIDFRTGHSVEEKELSLKEAEAILALLKSGEAVSECCLNGGRSFLSIVEQARAWHAKNQKDAR